MQLRNDSEIMVIESGIRILHKYTVLTTARIRYLIIIQSSRLTFMDHSVIKRINRSQSSFTQSNAYTPLIEDVQASPI